MYEALQKAVSANEKVILQALARGPATREQLKAACSQHAYADELSFSMAIRQVERDAMVTRKMGEEGQRIYCLQPIDPTSMELDAEFPAKRTAEWKANGIRPLSLMVCEYLGDGDPAFGGHADDRVMGVDGNILPRACGPAQQEPAVFLTVEEAHAAAQFVGNRRPGSKLGIVPRWR